MITTFSGRGRPQATPPRPGSSPSSSTSGRRPPGGRARPRRGTRAGRRPGPARTPRRARTAARTSRTRRWASSTWRLSGSSARLLGLAARAGTPGGGSRTGRPASREATRTRDAHVSWRRPARPICCHVAGDRARVAGEDRDVERADVDAQLERVRGDDAEDLAVAQPALDRPALRRQVAAAVAADPASAARGPRAAPRAGRSSMISTATRACPNTMVWRPARRNGSAQRWARVSAEPRAPVAGSRSGGSTSRTCCAPDGAPLRSMSRGGPPGQLRRELAPGSRSSPSSTR